MKEGSIEKENAGEQKGYVYPLDLIFAYNCSLRSCHRHPMALFCWQLTGRNLVSWPHVATEVTGGGNNYIRWESAHKKCTKVEGENGY